jgi:hypothetical protein
MKNLYFALPLFILSILSSNITFGQSDFFEKEILPKIDTSIGFNQISVKKSVWKNNKSNDLNALTFTLQPYVSFENNYYPSFEFIYKGEVISSRKMYAYNFKENQIIDVNIELPLDVSFKDISIYLKYEGEKKKISYLRMWSPINTITK